MLTKAEAVALELLIGNDGRDFEANCCTPYIGKKLAKRGLIRRLPPDGIGRLTLIEVTETGRRLYSGHQNVRMREATDAPSAR